MLSQFVLQIVARRGDMNSPGRKWHTPKDICVFDNVRGSQGNVEQQLVVGLGNVAELREFQIDRTFNHQVESRAQLYNGWLLHRDTVLSRQLLLGPLRPSRINRTT